jgi:hypothetical protein
MRWLLLRFKRRRLNSDAFLYLRIKSKMDIKSQIIREMDALNQNALQDFYGLLLNFLHGRRVDGEWSDLSAAQRSGLLHALSQVENEQTVPHEQLAAKYKNRYPGA